MGVVPQQNVREQKVIGQLTAEARAGAKPEQFILSIQISFVEIRDLLYM
jgi:hypothetical protein